MLDGDQDRIRLVNSLLMSLPGTPVVYYGEEIGMGENLALEGRLAVRTTMQWNDGPQGGFGPSDGVPSRRTPPKGTYGPENVNVSSQRGDPGSLLNWMAGAVRARRQIPELGSGDWTVLETGDPAVLAHRCSVDRSSFVAVHNLAADVRRVRIDAEVQEPLCPVLLAPDVEIHHEPDPLTIDLPRYGYAWMQTTRPLHGHTTDLPRT